MLRCDLHAAVLQGLCLSAQMLQIDHHSRPQHIGGVGTKNTGRKQVQHGFPVFIYYGVAGVVAALISDNDVIGLAEQVDHSALSLIAPVRTYNGSQHF